MIELPGTKIGWTKQVSEEIFPIPIVHSASLYSSPVERSCLAHHCDATENESSGSSSSSSSANSAHCDRDRDGDRDLRRSSVSASPAPPTGDHRLSP